MKWYKRGLIYAPRGDQAWARRNASFPTAEIHESGVVRVYVTSLDDNNFGRGGYVDLDPTNLTRIVAVAREPILELGSLGDFDDAGVNPFAVVKFHGRRLMYYQGWQRTLRAPYACFTGLAIQDGQRAFVKLRRTPVLERSEDEAHIRGAPFVMIENEALTMWYVSSTDWALREGQLHYHAGIRRAVSRDGLHWDAIGTPCISPAPGEYGIGRPSVIRDGALYRMWYSIRSFDRPYRLGYAESSDGVHWTRMDDRAGLDASRTGWDSQMLCYGYVLLVGEKTFMFYNGNQHGSTGFGLAELQE
jgi:hypothetical protein